MEWVSGSSWLRPAGNKGARLTGQLAVNSQGCLSADDEPIVVPDSWEISPDGNVIDAPLGKHFEVGDSLQWVGGEVTYDHKNPIRCPPATDPASRTVSGVRRSWCSTPRTRTT